MPKGFIIIVVIVLLCNIQHKLCYSSSWSWEPWKKKLNVVINYRYNIIMFTVNVNAPDMSGVTFSKYEGLM